MGGRSDQPGRGRRAGDGVTILDSTLRDGAQGTGIAFSVEDKLAAVRLLDQLGVAYIEAGNPGSNPKDQEFFRRAGELRLEHAQLAAFRRTPTSCPWPGRGPRCASCSASAGNSTWTTCWRPPPRKTCA